MSDDADAKLTPVKPPVGFRKVVRVKIGEVMMMMMMMMMMRELSSLPVSLSFYITYLLLSPLTIMVSVCLSVCLSVYHVCALSGYGGFTADKTKATKSFRKSWEADRVGAEISFRFFGSTVKIAIWQRRDGEYVSE